MECVTKDSNRAMLLRLPDNLYEALKGFPDKTGKLSFDMNTKKLIIEVVDENNDHSSVTNKYFANIEQADDDLCIFSVDGSRKATMKAQIAYRGNCIPEKSSIYSVKAQDEIKKISEYSTGIIDPKIDNKNQKRMLKLHEDHKSFVMANAEQAMQATLRKKYKEKRVRGDPEKVKNMLFELFAHQRY